ncbi:MAG TPA: DUF3710 domain-containing protein [Actinocrinis sp.]|jgi:hypothetical protein|uniref:DUF3710 domain-containing protein n=1 Tax=Actinocrinis sp. TaxID=1920516 RepID=UPI002DDC9086|nr:DUF3710 domain-containing protein [Actinocrinis sp.]HEV3169905.1 DUF3710 domain-containing protein [Actinocrinis sp.]
MFRRRGRGADEEPEVGPDESVDDAYEDGDDSDEGGRAAADRDAGPWDAADLDEPQEGRVDLGGLLVPAIQGMEIRLEVSEQQQVMAITLVLGQSAIQLQAFAAPRTEGIWTDVCDEIAVEITKQGGIVDRGVGPFGPELRARVPVRLPDGGQGMQVLRFLGADGPRWFLRGLVSGQAAVQHEAAGAVEHVFRETVVVRGTEAMAPRDPIPLKFPPQARPAEPPKPDEPSSPYQGDLNPFERGPEITEVR